MQTKKLKGGLTNLTGTKVGHLKVIKKKQYVSKAGRPKWDCICEAEGCGKKIAVPHNRLIDKHNPKSHCGCLRGGLPKKHPREYHTWWDAKNRCHNPDHPSYPSYGAKGIRMCGRWLESFTNFLQDMGPRPKGGSLDRIDPHGPYDPGNCRWADIKTQARNKKDTKWVQDPRTGKPIQAATLAEELGLTYQKLRAQMIDNGTWQKKVERPLT